MNFKDYSAEYSVNFGEEKNASFAISLDYQHTYIVNEFR